MREPQGPVANAVTESRRQRIGFAILPDESGHQNAAIAFARRLMDAGFDVAFVGVADDREAIEKRGFSYVSLAEDVWPVGLTKKMKADQDDRITTVERVYPCLCPTAGGAETVFVDD